MSRRNQDFQTIRSEGGLLPPDLLRRLLDPQSKLEGMNPEDYGLPPGERLNGVITQSWTRLRKHWTDFRSAASHLPENEPATGLTNDKWNLPLLRELGFGLLPTTPAPEINGRTYAINRFLGPVPLHLIGCGLSLDRRATGVRGAAAANPHGLVQEFLNRSSGHLWAILSNGLRLRTLRDNATLSRQSFLEFDLEAMFDGEVYSDFVLLWLVAHATRFAPRQAGRPDNCWIEQWTKIADEQGTRALGDLRTGVERALQALGEGFTTHPKNHALRDAFRTNRVSMASFHGQLLRVVYRFIFLFVAEDRTIEGQPLLHPRDESEAAQVARERHAAHFSTARLREMAGRIKGSRHGDLWRQFQLLVGALSGDPAFAAVRERLALPALGSFLWNPSSTADLNNSELTNHDLLEALRNLAFTRQGKVLRPVDYRNLGAEELGGVYESLLSLTPQISADGARFSFAEFAGSERKTSGSYYTPDSLVQCLLDSALDPVVDEAIKGKNGTEAEDAILALKVCDPAVGSGHFLVGAAHRLARHLARVRALAQGESEPSPLLYQQALRDVIRRCLYGVDMNPMAAELCRVSLWLEALEPGKPLSFLDHHIQCGNSLLGTTPALIGRGIPDEAFSVLEGDDKAWTSTLKKRNKGEREGQTSLLGLFAKEPDAAYGSLSESMVTLDNMADDSLDAVKSKEEGYQRLSQSPEYLRQKLVADAWCAAFIWEKTREAPEAITTSLFQKLLSDPEAVNKATTEHIRRYAGQYQFFHWHLAFPDVLNVPVHGEPPENEQVGWSGGFDFVIGNPPWERVKLQEREWFAVARPDIAGAKSASLRRKLIVALAETDPIIYRKFLEAKRQAEAESQYVRHSGLFPLCGRGDVNTYSVFTELARVVTAKNGRAGLIIPSGIATDETTSDFFSDLVSSEQLVTLYGFENEGKFFSDLMHNFRFSLLVMSGSRVPTQMPDLSYGLWSVSDLLDQERHFSMTVEEFELINPITKTSPLFRFRNDAILVKQIYRKIPTLFHRNPLFGTWNHVFSMMLHMANDSEHFVEISALPEHQIKGTRLIQGSRELLPLYEAKMIFHFDHRYASAVASRTGGQRGSSEYTTPEQHSKHDFYVEPRYWVSDHVVDRFISQKKYLIGFRGITGAVVNLRTVVFAILPVVAVGHTMLLVDIASSGAKLASCFVANMNSLVLDYVSRQKLGGTALSYFILNQLPVLPPEQYLQPFTQDMKAIDFISPRVLELTYTSDDLKGFADDFGYLGSPFVWNEARREIMMRELDAAFALLYGLSRDQLTTILEHFRSLAKIESNDLGEYRTKRLTLEIYDEMAEAIRTGVPYKTPLDPPPADPSVAHPPREAERLVEQAKVILEEPVVEEQPVVPADQNQGKKKISRGVRLKQGTILAYTVIENQDATDLDQIKMEKLLYFAQELVGLNLEMTFDRGEFGPFDNDTYAIESYAERVKKWIRTKRTKKQFATELKPGENLEELHAAINKYYRTWIPKLQKLYAEFKQFPRTAIEIWATLHFSWKSLSSQGASVTREMVIQDVLNWKGNKRGFAEANLRTVMQEMEKRGYLRFG